MPYILTTYGRREVYGTPYAVVKLSETVVATMEEARWATAEAIGRAYWSIEAPGVPFHGAFTPSERLDADEAISESGGTVGPLPNGTVIEVRKVEAAKEEA